MKRNIFLILIISFMTGCTALKSNQGSYTTRTYLEPIRYDKDNGGHLVVINNNTEHGVFKFRPTDDEKIKDMQKLSTWTPFSAFWKIGRNPLGMNPDYSNCGVREPIDDGYKNKLIREYKEKTGKELVFQDWDIYYNCIDNVRETFNSQTTHKYYYARMPENHLVTYPAKSDLYYRWNLSFYIGGVNDLSLEAVPNEYKNNLDKLRSHKCHKWGASSNHTCYDLPNGDKNIYYAINEEPYIIEDGKKKPKNRYSMDVRVSEPLNWIEIDGIEINKEIFDYLNKICEDSLVCHLNNYTGNLTQEQKEYIKKNKWSTDEVWKEKPKKEYESSNPWR